MTPAATTTPNSLPSSKPIPIPNANPTSHQIDLQAPILNIDRDQLFSPDIARVNGLDPATFAILEIPNGSSSLYNALLLYAAHYAVDVTYPDDFPKSSVETSDNPLSLSGDAKSPESPSEAPSAEAPNENVPTGEATNGSTFIRGLNGAPIPCREGPGHLSTLWNCPDDRCDPLTFSDSDSDSDTGSDTDHVLDDDDVDDDNTSASANDADDGSPDTLRAVASLGALKKKTEPPVQRYQMGIGYAKINLEGHVVFLHHCAYGLPVSESYSIQVFRTLVIAADDAFHLKQLCAVALKWRSDREQRNQRARPGRFTLFRFKTNGGGCGDWCNQGYKRSRPAKSVILPEGQLESIVRDIKDFVARDTKAWYEAHGLPHRRSYLFHGPPGCGKTSTIKMIAGMFRLNACFLSLTASDFSNQALQDALSTMPRRGLLVLEDVDVLFNEDRKSEASQALTFSGMLNALDGLISVDGIITIFTTNHIEKLDPALIRGGRVDRRFEFVHPSSKQMAALFKSFYENASDAIAERFADTVLSRAEDEARSIATLQQHFIYTRKMTAEQSVDMIPDFFAEFYPKGGKTRNPLYL